MNRSKGLIFVFIAFVIIAGQGYMYHQKKSAGDFALSNAYVYFKGLPIYQSEKQYIDRNLEEAHPFVFNEMWDRVRRARNRSDEMMKLEIKHYFVRLCGILIVSAKKDGKENVALEIMKIKDVLDLE